MQAGVICEIGSATAGGGMSAWVEARLHSYCTICEGRGSVRSDEGEDGGAPQTEMRCRDQSMAHPEIYSEPALESEATLLSSEGWGSDQGLG